LREQDGLAAVYVLIGIHDVEYRAQNGLLQRTLPDFTQQLVDGFGIDLERLGRFQANVFLNVLKELLDDPVEATMIHPGAPEYVAPAHQSQFAEIDGPVGQ